MSRGTCVGAFPTRARADGETVSRYPSSAAAQVHRRRHEIPDRLHGIQEVRPGLASRAADGMPVGIAVAARAPTVTAPCDAALVHAEVIGTCCPVPVPRWHWILQLRDGLARGPIRRWNGVSTRAWSAVSWPEPDAWRLDACRAATGARLTRRRLWRSHLSRLGHDVTVCTYDPRRSSSDSTVRTRSSGCVAPCLRGSVGGIDERRSARGVRAASAQVAVR